MQANNRTEHYESSLPDPFALKDYRTRAQTLAACIKTHVNLIYARESPQTPTLTK